MISDLFVSLSKKKTKEMRTEIKISNPHSLIWNLESGIWNLKSEI